MENSLRILLFIAGFTMHTINRYLVITLTPLLAALSFEAYADIDLYALSLEELLQIKVNSVSRLNENLSDTTSNVSIITQADINISGARNLYDVLSTLPGINVNRSKIGENILQFRGIRTSSNDKFLLMLNGHTLNDARTGGASFLNLDNLPVQNIEQIEVVRGPISALYGANAFLGVINIVSKKGKDIQGGDVHASIEMEANNLIAHKFNLLYGDSYSHGDYSVNLNSNIHSGAELYSPSDRFTRAGEADNGKRQYDLQFNLRYDNFNLQGRYGQSDSNALWGFTDVLSYQNQLEHEQGFLELSYKKSLNEKIKIQLLGFIDYAHYNNDYELFPAGTISAGPLSPWNDSGYLGNPQAKLRTRGVDGNIAYQFNDSNALVVGVAHKFEEQYDIIHEANFNPGPLQEVEDVSDVYNYSQPAERQIRSAYLEYQWRSHQNLMILSAIRWDDYSDFGSTTNPQIGINWNASDTLILKAQYAQGFHAPTFFNQFNTNNPVIEGNPDLSAEDIKTSEIGFTYTPNVHLQWVLSAYHHELENLVSKVPGTLKNIDNLQSANTDGIETELTLQSRSQNRWILGYSYSNTQFDNGDKLPFVNNMQLNFRWVHSFNQQWIWNNTISWQDQTIREQTDTRDDMNAYSLFNSNVIFTSKNYGYSLSAGLWNVFDKSYHSPAAQNTYINDYPEQGRSLVIQLNYPF